jgi:signal transduction histidine kinase/CheY-like chemotaxis protein
LKRFDSLDIEKIMKKYYFAAVFSFLAVLAILLFSFWKIYVRHLAFQREMLEAQVHNCGNEIEKNVLLFTNEVNYLMYSEDLIGIINSSVQKNTTLSKIEMLYTNYRDLIKNMYIYDQNKNVVNLFYDKKNSLIIDPYTAQKQKALASKELVQKTPEGYQYSIPIYKNNALVGNIVFSLDFAKYINGGAEQYHLNQALWQWVTDENGNIISYNLKQKVEFTSIEKIQDDLKRDLSGYCIHHLQINNKKISILSSYYLLDLMKQHLGIVFSMDNSGFLSYLVRTFILCAFVISAILVLLLYLFRTIGLRHKNEEKVSLEYGNLKSIVDALPLGIMVMDSSHQVRLMNPAAREMLHVREGEDIHRRSILDRFIHSKEYYEDEDSEAAFDSNQFVLYKNEGEEVVVYKKEIPHVINDEEMILSAFIDITSIEKARKYEAAANTAKSEFLAKMSHEIRTPMNGIIGMTEALHQENLTKEQIEYVEIVRKSADLLLNLIDDLLDFSKIEAGKMQLEEIPFKLRDEIKVALDLFRAIVEEKKLNLTVKIDQHVPDNIIGDPFRLRQVLSNLISNAVKFTHEGEIVVGAELEEEYDGNLTLLFYVEDTGVGIPHHRIESIFSSFTQADESTSRKYGGSGLGTTISKQLVTLMNGEIWVESPSTISTNPKYPGSKFSFTIEVFSNERLIKNIKTDHITHLDQIRSHIITQNTDIKRRLNKFLESGQMKYDVFSYQPEKIHELQARLKDASTSPHILFINDDANLNGMQLAKRLKDDKYIDSFIVFLISSNHKAEYYIQAKRYGVDYYLVEPFEYNDMLGYILEAFSSIIRTPAESVKTLKGDISVLVAEDNIINQKVALTIFNQLGLSIDIAQNGNEAIQKIKEKCYDIVFMDLMMPDRDGIQTTVELRGQGYQMPIVAMTATASSKSKSKALASGMNDYITKPVRVEIVKNILYKWFA